MTDELNDEVPDLFKLIRERTTDKPTLGLKPFNLMNDDVQDLMEKLRAWRTTQIQFDELCSRLHQGCAEARDDYYEAESASEKAESELTTVCDKMFATSKKSLDTPPS
jgi:hypothetical protein